MKITKATRMVKQIIAVLSSTAKAKILAIKGKTTAIKTRLIIFSLLRNKKFLMSSLSHSFQRKKSSIAHKLQALVGHHDKNSDDEDDIVEDEISNAVVLYKDNIICEMAAQESLPNQTHTELVEKNQDCSVEEEADDGHNKYPDLTHSLFDSEDPGDFEDPGGSVIDLVKNSKEEAGEEFSLEEEIDHVADLFIKRFHRQMLMQKQLSFKNYQEMLKRGA